jgi:hypothetical protein
MQARLAAKRLEMLENPPMTGYRPMTRRGAHPMAGETGRWFLSN